MKIQLCPTCMHMILRYLNICFTEDNELGINNIHPTVAYPKVKIEYSNDNLQSVYVHGK